MILHAEPDFPSARRYVLKLHRAARPAREAIVGRLENMFSGEHVEFTDGEQLLGWLVLDLQTADTDSETNS